MSFLIFSFFLFLICFCKEERVYMDRPVRFCYSFLLDANFHTGSVSIEEAEKIEYYYRNNISCAKGKIKNPNKHNSDDNESNSTTSFDFYFDNCSDYYQLYNYNEIYTLSLNALSKDSLLFSIKNFTGLTTLLFIRSTAKFLKEPLFTLGRLSLPMNTGHILIINAI